MDNFDTQYVDLIKPHIDKLNLTLTELSMIDELVITVQRFYELNDAAHKLDHAIDVMLLGLELYIFLTTNGMKGHDTVPIRRSIIAAALLHDIGLSFDRDTHNVVACNMINTGSLSDWYDKFCKCFDIVKLNINYAILEHRASYEGGYTTVVSELIASADRGVPNIYKVCKHAKYPAVYTEYFKDQLKTMRDTIDDKQLLIKIYKDV